MFGFLRDNEAHAKLDAISFRIEKLIREVAQMTAAMEALKAEVTELDSVVESVLTLITGLVDQLKNANTDAEIQEVIASLEAEKARLVEAVTANTEVA